MRKLKILFLIVYTVTLLYLIYQAYLAWKTPLVMVYIAIISLWTGGVWALSRIYDWLFHEHTEEKRKQKEKLEQEEAKKREKLEQKRNKEIERNNEKRTVSGRLLSEIERNQKLLQPLSDSVAKVLDGNDFTEYDKLPNMLIFESRIYSGSLDKFGVLDKDCRNKIIQYYSELKHIEEGYKKLDIQGCSYEHLVYLQLREIGKWRIPKPGWHEIEEFLRNTKKVHDFGEELIIGLKEQIGIKSTGEETELPVKEHSRTKSPDIRKLWSECEKLRTRVSEDRKRIIDYVENEYGGLPPDFEWEPHPDEKKRPIYEMFEEYYQKAKILENGKIKDSKEFVETIIKDKTFSEMFETLRKNEADLYQKANEIELWLVKIEPDFEKRHNELNNLYESLK